ncbi:MAG: hypothetical protein ACFNM5_00025 [Candidatus Saccharibacteria bacterium]|jgi:hypothetical protein cdiviTM7_02679
METPTKESSIRKRQQIFKANRMMFLWVAMASAVIGFALVISISLMQRIIYNQKVIGEKNKTYSTLANNNKKVSQLEDQIKTINYSSDVLKKLRAKDSDDPIQVVLDALPSDSNRLALGSSLQNVLLANIPGSSLESMKVESTAEAGSVKKSTATTGTVENNSLDVTFTLKINSGSEDSIREMLTRLEKSIRTFKVTNVKIEYSLDKMNVTVTAKAYYEPAKVVELTEKVVKP